MKVLLVGNYLPDRQFSMLGFYDCLLEALPKLGVETVGIQPRALVGKQPGKLEKWRGYVDKFVIFPRELRRASRAADIVHVCDQGNAMYMAHTVGKPTLLTCHDVLPIRAAKGQIDGWKVRATGQRLQAWISSSFHLATRVACVSLATKEDLVGLRLVNEEKLDVVLNGFYKPLLALEAEQATEIARSLGLPAERPFIFHIGNNGHYKNRPGFVKIVQELRRKPEFASMTFVMAGKPLDDEVRQLIVRLGQEEAIVELASLSDEQVAALYLRAEALVFPSLREGFGLPVIEAQAYECPVFTSNRAPMTEAGGDAAVYFDPEDPVAAASKIAENWDQRATLRAKGSQNAKNFSTERMAKDYVSVYRKMLDN